MELDSVRKELNNYDTIINNMINLRMSLIPIVADIKAKNNIPIFQEKREDEIYKNIEVFAKEKGADSDLIKDIYQLMIANATKTQESMIKDSNSTILKNDIDFSKLENVQEEFEKLDILVQEEIPQIISNIVKRCEAENVNLNQIATLYYYKKLVDIIK